MANWDDSNRAAEETAKKSAQKKFKYIEDKLRKNYKDVLSAPYNEPLLPWYEDLGYYHFQASEGYTVRRDVQKTSSYGNGSYSGSIDSSGNIRISENTSSATETVTKESSRTASAHRMIKVVKQGVTAELQKKEKAFLSDPARSGLFLSARRGAETHSPSRFVFFLFHLISILCAACIGLFYILGMAAYGVEAPRYWDGALLSKIPGLFEFSKANEKLLFVALGGAVLFFLLQTLLFRCYINKFQCRRYHKIFSVFTFNKIGVWVAIAHALLSPITVSVSEGVVIGMILISLLLKLLAFLENLTRLVAILFALFTAIWSMIQIFGCGYYHAVAALCRRRADLLTQEDHGYAYYEALYEDILCHTYRFAGYKQNKIFHYDDFMEDKYYIRPEHYPKSDYAMR